MAKFRFIVFLLTCFFIAAAPVRSFSEKIHKYTDPRQAIEVKPGQEFLISIESNPTTGYAWELAEALEEFQRAGVIDPSSPVAAQEMRRTMEMIDQRDRQLAAGVKHRLARHGTPELPPGSHDAH